MISCVPGVLWMLWAAPVAPAPTVPETALADFSGRYRYVGGHPQHNKLRREIDATIEPMLDLIEGLARRRLNESLGPAARYDFTIDGSGVRIDDRTGHPMTGTANGAAFQWKSNDGKHRKSTIRHTGRVIRIRVVGPHSTTRIVYKLDRSASRLTRTTTIDDDRLPMPLTYSFSYRRTDG